MPYVIFNPQTREYRDRQSRYKVTPDPQEAQIFYNSEKALSVILNTVRYCREHCHYNEYQKRYDWYNNATVLPARIVVDSDPNT